MTLSVIQAIASNDRMINEMERSGSGQILGTISEFVWRDRGKPRKTSVRIPVFELRF
jgi:hypothetical protein